MIHKLIYYLGMFRRNPSLAKYLVFLNESDFWSKEQLEEYQINKCREFLAFVGKYSPYYKNLFQKIQFVPNNIQSIEEIKVIPSIDKSVLLCNAEAIHSSYPFKKVFLSETSGSTGQPLTFYRNEEWDSQNRATMFRGYGWYGVKPWDKNGYFWGYNIEKKFKHKIRILDFLQNRFRLFSYDKEEVKRFAQKLSGAKFLSGYSSMIYEVAKIINKEGIKINTKLKMIKGTSEKIFDNYHTETQKAFGLKIISEYGAAETGGIAFECPEGCMHVNIENVIVETENNEVIVTNLLSRSFPIIRYKLGDYVTLAEPQFKCKCGRNHPVIIDVLGRVGKKIIGHQNEYPSLTFYYVFKNLADKNLILNYQALQNESGQVLLKIEQNKSDSDEVLRSELNKYFGNDIDFIIQYDQQLHSMNGKLRDFITTIGD